MYPTEPSDLSAARHLSLRVWLLMALTTSAMAGNGLIVPVLSLYGESFGASGFQIGLLITLFGVARLCLNYPTGASYRPERAVAFLMAGNAMIAVGAIGAAMTDNMTFLLVCRTIQGAGSGIFLTTVGTVIAESTEPGKRGRMMASYQGSVFIGAAMGPVIGGALAGHWGIHAPFWAYGAVSAMAVGLCYLFQGTAGSAAEPREPLSLRALLRTQALYPNLVMAFSFGFARTAALWQSIPLVAVARFDMSLGKVGLALTITALANLLILPLSGIIVDRFGSRHMPYVASLLFAASLLLIAVGQHETTFWIGVTIAGFAGGLNGPALASALIDLAGNNSIGTYMGAQRTFQDLGFIFGPILAGLAIDLTGNHPQVGLYLTATLLVAASLLWIRNGTGRSA